MTILQGCLHIIKTSTVPILSSSGHQFLLIPAFLQLRALSVPLRGVGSDKLLSINNDTDDVRQDKTHRAGQL